MINIRRDKAIEHLVAKGGSVAEAMRRAGYSKRTARNPKKLTQSKEFKEKTKPLADRLKDEIDRIQLEMASRELSKEEYKDLSDVLDKQVKNYQILTGGDTGRERILVLPPEVINKYGIKSSSSPENNSQ